MKLSKLSKCRLPACHFDVSVMSKITEIEYKLENRDGKDKHTDMSADVKVSCLFHFRAKHEHCKTAKGIGNYYECFRLSLCLKLKFFL